jgi:hypothetical protein
MRARPALVAGVLFALVLALPTAGADFTNPTSNDANSWTSIDDFNMNPSFRVTTYELTTGSGFTGATYTLTLNQNLSTDYFVLLRGAAGNYTSGTHRGPDENYARIDQDPFGNDGHHRSCPQPGNPQRHKHCWKTLHRRGQQLRRQWNRLPAADRVGPARRRHDGSMAALPERAARRLLAADPRLRVDRELGSRQSSVISHQ